MVAFCFYAFFAVSREMIRVAFSTNSGPSFLWVIEKPAMDFYNLFFAFLSCIIGQRTCFEIWYNHPGQFRNRRYHYKRNRIVHDQRSLTWYFLFWFAKVGVVYGAFFAMANFHFVFSLYPDYNYVFILIILVLYLNQWLSVRLSFKGRSLKWMLVSILVICSLSYGMSKFNVIVYEKVNHGWLSNTVEYKYKIEIPSSSITQRIMKRSLIEEFYYVFSKEDSSYSKPILLFQNKEFALDDLNWIMEEVRESRHEQEMPFMTFRLTIDRHTKMKHVKKLKLALRRAGMLRIAYAVIPDPVLLDRRAYFDYCIIVRLPPYCPELQAKVDTIRNPNLDLKSTNFAMWDCLYLNNTEMKGNRIEISMGKDIVINDKVVALDNVKHAIRTAIQNSDEKTIMVVTVKSDVSYGPYIKLKANLYSAVYELRDEEAMQVSGHDFDELRYESRETYNEIRKKYPIRIAEPTEAYFEYKRYIDAQNE